MRLKSAVIVANPYKKDSLKLKEQVISFLRKSNVKIGNEGDVLITVSGDGTLLYAKEFYKKPIIGIGGTHSFICQINQKNWKEKLAGLLSGFKVTERSMLAAKVDGRRTEDALNEVCIRSHNLRVLTLTLRINKKTYRFRADGLIFATPTGSTGYAYSCGGRELGLKSKKYVVVAIAPYRREFVPLIVPDSTVSKIIVETHGKADVIIDGQFLHELKNGSKVTVWKSEKKVRFVLQF